MLSLKLARLGLVVLSRIMLGIQGLAPSDWTTNFEVNNTSKQSMSSVDIQIINLCVSTTQPHTYQVCVRLIRLCRNTA